MRKLSLTIRDAAASSPSDSGAEGRELGTDFIVGRPGGGGRSVEHISYWKREGWSRKVHAGQVTESCVLGIGRGIDIDEEGRDADL